MVFNKNLEISGKTYTFQNFVEFSWSWCYLDYLKPLGMKLASTSETQRNQFWSCNMKVKPSPFTKISMIIIENLADN